MLRWCPFIHSSSPFRLLRPHTSISLYLLQDPILLLQPNKRGISSSSSSLGLMAAAAAIEFPLFAAVVLVIALSAPLASSAHISAAPALLPDPISPVASPPALSPDYIPLFPSPAGGEDVSPSPSEHTIPFIPSFPSPPNPDATANAPFSPDAASVPLTRSADSSSVGLNLPGAVTLLALGVLGFC